MWTSVRLWHTDMPRVIGFSKGLFTDSRIAASRPDLRMTAEKLFAAALAPTTSQTYASAFRSWSEFCLLRGVNINPLRPTEEAFSFYVAWAQSRPNPLKYQTVQKYLAGIRSVLLGEGITFTPWAEMPILHRILRGWKKMTYAADARPRLPITVDILKQILPLLDLSKPNDRTLAAAMATAVYGLLRCGEVSAKTKKAARYPRRGDLTGDAVRKNLKITASKGDIFSEGVNVQISANGDATCPIKLLDRMLSESKKRDAAAPLFVFDDKPLTRSVWIAETRRLLAKARFDPSLYSGHSFRKGGAQSLFDAGVSRHIIQTLGRWKSNSFQLYIKLTVEAHAEFSRRMAAAPSAQLML